MAAAEVTSLKMEPGAIRPDRNLFIKVPEAAVFGFGGEAGSKVGLLTMHRISPVW